MKRDEIIREIQALAKRDGKTPGRMRFEAVTGLGEHAWRGKYWARWNDVIAEAGLSPNEKVEAFPEDVLLGAFLDLAIELGRVPTDSDLRLRRRSNPELPGHSTFQNRFDGKPDLLRKVLAFAESRDTPEHVLDAIRRALPKDAAEPEDDATPQSIVGYVYLLKSGKYYKIGKAVAPDRRRYEIGLQLPEKAEPIHSIETDDPSGIETYWHNRFKDKRLNGEWFDLSRDELRAFKRRKFM